MFLSLTRLNEEEEAYPLDSSTWSFALQYEPWARGCHRTCCKWRKEGRDPQTSSTVTKRRENNVVVKELNRITGEIHWQKFQEWNVLRHDIFIHEIKRSRDKIDYWTRWRLGTQQSSAQLQSDVRFLIFWMRMEMVWIIWILILLLLFCLIMLMISWSIFSSRKNLHISPTSIRAPTRNRHHSASLRGP